MSFDLVQADTGTVLRLTLTDRANVAIPLAGCSVKLRYKIGPSAVVEKSMTIVDASAGIVSYQFAALDLPYAGTMQYEVKVISPDTSFIKSLDSLTLQVRRALV
jgi:hypothetical protein